MKNIKFNREVAESMARALLDAVDQDTLERFFYEEHLEYYLDNVSGETISDLTEDARLLRVIEDDEVLVLDEDTLTAGE
jgi:hypothetical protein